MPIQWSEMKARVEDQMDSDPQRATLARRAWQGVEEGLRHLASVGYPFELSPKGTIEGLEQLKPGYQPPLPLGIKEAQACFKPAKVG